MTINISLIKEKILETIKEKGPSLPASLTKVSGMNLTFTSAILSELLAERKLKISNLKVGSSPLYYLEGQEEKLENFIDNLKPAEKDAFLKLKQNRILEDEKQDPQTRVALRSIKDFAVPIKVGEKLFWKYHLLSDEKAIDAIEPEKEVAIGEERVIGQSIWNDIKKEFSKEDVEEIVKKRINEIVEKIKQEGLLKPEVEEKKEKTEKKEEVKFEEKKDEQSKIEEISVEKEKLKKETKKKEKKQNLFLESVKKIIEEKGFSLKNVLKESKEKAIFICVKGEKGFLFLTYNKKSLDEKELLKDYKKYSGNFEEIFLIFKGDKKEKMEEKKKFYTNLKDIFSLT